MSKYLTPIKAGEYDLVNISLIGFDPNTGKSYEECSTAWKEALAEVTKEAVGIRWWHFSAKAELNAKLVALQSHFGAPAGFFSA